MVLNTGFHMGMIYVQYIYISVEGLPIKLMTWLGPNSCEYDPRTGAHPALLGSTKKDVLKYPEGEMIQIHLQLHNNFTIR